MQVSWLEMRTSRRSKVIWTHVDELDIVLVQEFLLIRCCFLYCLKEFEWTLFLLLLDLRQAGVRGIFILNGSEVFAGRTCNGRLNLTHALFRLSHNVLHNWGVESLVKDFFVLLFFMLQYVVSVHIGQEFLDERVHAMSANVLLSESGYFGHEFHFTELLCLYVCQSSCSLCYFLRTSDLQLVELSMLFKPKCTSKQVYVVWDMHHKIWKLTSDELFWHVLQPLAKWFWCYVPDPPYTSHSIA